jgi:hypothetical protein
MPIFAARYKRRRTMLKIFIFVIPVSIITLLSSCGSKEEAVKDYQVTADTLSSSVRTDMNLIRAGIPSPIIISRQISKSGYSYNKSILNSTGKGSGYSTKYQAAANLGIYGADFGYVAGYAQSQDVLEYVAQIAKLAKTVGVESAFSGEFGNKVSSSVGKEDTLMDVIDNAYAKAERNLQSNDRVSTTAIIIAGGWIEGLYIASEIVGTKAREPKTMQAYKKVYDQIYAFQYVSDLLKQYNKDADCVKMLEELKPLVNIMTDYARIPKLGQGDLDKIKDAVAPVRSRITG